MKNWILWDRRIDKPFVRIFFSTEAEALKHKERVVSAYNEKRVDADVWPREINTSRPTTEVSTHAALNSQKEGGENG